MRGGIGNKRFNLGVFVIILLLIGCDRFDCNYEELRSSEYAFISELNKSTEHIDTLYNDVCLKGFFYVYVKSELIDAETNDEIEAIAKKLQKENMPRDIWVFNNKRKFVYRLFRYNDDGNEKFIKTDLQYPNQ